MHVKVSGSYSLVTGVWSKISGTWTKMKAVLVKTSAWNTSYTWAVNYIKHPIPGINPSYPGIYWGNTHVKLGFSYGVFSGANYYLKSGTYSGKASFYIGTGPGPETVGFVGSYANSTTYKCAYDGQTVTDPTNDSGHWHYSVGNSYTVNLPQQTITADGNEYGLYFRGKYASQIYIELSSLEFFKVS